MEAPHSTLLGNGDAGELICLRCGSPQPSGSLACLTCADSIETMAAESDEPGVPRTSGLIPVRALDDDGTLEAGTEVDAYLIEYLLGSGGVGNVYAARHAQLDREVALKHLRPDVARNAKVVQRFFDEARAANRVRHENIVEITDFREHERLGAYLIMERLEGQDLADLIFELGQAFPVERAIRIAQQTASALGAAHGAGIVHRDLKPDNIFLTRRAGVEDFVKVLDFGVAKLGEGIASTSAFETAAGTLLGTPAYMAPEQAMGHAVDHRTDVYALGVILFEMMTGTLPFDAETAGEFIVLHATTAPRRVSDFRPDAPPRLIELIEDCLAKAPEDRPSSMIEVEAVLELVLSDPDAAATARRFASDLPTAPPLDSPDRAGAHEDEDDDEDLDGDREMTARLTLPMQPPAARRSPWLLIGGAFAFAAVTLGVAFWIVSRRPSPAVTSNDGSSVVPAPGDALATLAPEVAESPLPELEASAAAQAELPAEVPATIEVVFRSTPPGATVRLDGQEAPLGVTPLSTTLPQRDGTGRFTLELEGHQRHDEELSLSRSILASVRLVRERRSQPRPSTDPSTPAPAPTGRRGVLSF